MRYLKTSGDFKSAPLKVKAPLKFAISTNFVIPNEDFNIDKKNMTPNTSSPLFQESLKANGTYYSNSIGYKLKFLK